MRTRTPLRFRAVSVAVLACCTAGVSGLGLRAEDPDVDREASPPPPVKIDKPVDNAPANNAPADNAPVLDAAEPTSGPDNLRFSFQNTPWREVVAWLAEETGLALHAGELPTGSFSYTDPNPFDTQQAIDRINLFLLPQGFTMIRSGTLLSVVNLGDPRSAGQLDALARTVSMDQLEQLNGNDVVKCIFPLGDLESEEAIDELSSLNLMTTPSVFSRTNRMMVTDTAAKLKSVKTILDAFKPAEMGNGTVVKTIELAHADADDVLAVARPHLGMATGEMLGIDISLSVDAEGKSIYVTGIEDRVELFENLISVIDQPELTQKRDANETSLRPYPINGGNVQTIYRVLQTILSGKSVRLSIDDKANSIVAMATPEIHDEIATTISQLQESEADFEVIPLKTVDPYLAITLLREMLNLPNPSATSDPNVPKIDADPENMRLFVRAKQHQIDEIKEIVEGLDTGTTRSEDRDSVRVVPMKNQNVEHLLETAAKFWRAANPIVLYPSAAEVASEQTERVVTANYEEEIGSTELKKLAPVARFLTDNVRSQSPAIRCQVTVQGLLLQSEDAEALDRFEQHLRTLAGPLDAIPSPPIVFYLKYVKPNDALRMLAELLDGGESAKDDASGTLVSGNVSSGFGSYLGSIVTSREGTRTMMAGTITVVADTRLNRLIAQGTVDDIETIEEYLKIIDKDRSITEIETYGTSHVIELSYADATEVAKAIREAFAGRIVGGEDGRDRKEGEGDRKKDRNEARSALRTAQSETLEPKMTIAVHAPSNSLIVTAPESLFQDVQQLAMKIDSQSQQSVQVLTVPDNVEIEMLQEILTRSGRRPGGTGAQ